MKKIFTFIITAVLALSTAISVQASPADPTPFKYTQPDGSTITLRMHGDEFYSWVTDENGNEVEMGEDGFYHIVSSPLSPAEKSAAAEQLRTGPMVFEPFFASSGSNVSIGSHNFLVLLIEFSDVQFTTPNPQLAFSNLLNKEGYNLNGAIGSARDYFMDNSRNHEGEVQFTPYFDVVGPIQVTKERSYYGQHSKNLEGTAANDAHVGLLLLEACRILDEQGFDFSKYDENNDGDLDNVFFYFAGGGEAEHAGADTIWPNKWDMLSYWYYMEDHSYPYYYSTHPSEFTFDGKKLYGYACTSELKGTTTTMCGIGTFCHEFSHTIGLHDYYDTNGSTNGEGDGLFHFSIMSSGNYNSNGNIPPYYTSIEKASLGWTSWDELQSGQNYTLNESNRTSAYRTVLSSTGSDEYFVYEARNGQKWDSPLPTGLLIYHVRESRFNNENYRNKYENNPGVYFKAAYPSSLNPPHASEANVPYPGPKNVTAFDNNSPSPATDWSGKWHGDEISNIKYDSSNHQVTFTYTKKDPDKKTMSGKITDYSTGQGISGASIVVSYVGGTKSATTGSDGSYSFDFGNISNPAFSVSISKSGYFSLENESFTHPGGDYIKNFMLVSTSAATEGIELRRCQEQVSSFPNYGNDGINNWKGVIMFSASDMKPFVGLRITDISFRFGGTKPTAAKAIVYFGTEQALDQVVNNPTPKQYNEIKVTKDLIIPAGKDVYVGYSLENCDDHPFTIDENNKNNNGFYVAANNSVNWSDNSSIGSLLIKFKVSSEPNTPDEKDEMYTLGYSGLNLEPGKVYDRNTTISLSLAESSDDVKSVTYYYDGTKKNGSSINTGWTAGDHTIKAEVTYESGKKETIIQVIKVQ